MTYEMTNRIDTIEKHRHSLTGDLETHVYANDCKYRIVPTRNRDSKRIVGRAVIRHPFEKTITSALEEIEDFDVYKTHGTRLIDSKDTLNSIISDIRGIIR